MFSGRATYTRTYMSLVCTFPRGPLSEFAFLFGVDQCLVARRRLRPPVSKHLVVALFNMSTFGSFLRRVSLMVAVLCLLAFRHCRGCCHSST